MSLIQTQNKGYGSFIVLENDLIGRFINYHGCWEKHIYSVYSQLITPNDVVIDAGANIGFHTVQFAHKANKVYAFEPQKLIYNILSTNILFNDVSSKVEHYRLALGDKPGKLYMEPLSNRDEKDGSHNFGGRGLVTKDGEEEVDVITLDSLNIDPNIIKMDIQGSELYALKGAESTLNRCEPWLILENYLGREDDEKIYKWLINKGYEFFRFSFKNETGEVIPHEDCIVYKPKKHKQIKQFLNQLKNA